MKAVPQFAHTRLLFTADGLTTDHYASIVTVVLAQKAMASYH